MTTKLISSHIISSERFNQNVMLKNLRCELVSKVFRKFEMVKLKTEEELLTIKRVLHCY